LEPCLSWTCKCFAEGVVMVGREVMVVRGGGGGGGGVIRVVAAAAAVELNSGYVDFFRLDVTFLVFDFFDAL
jgi:hypothetical protein